ncbi:MAG TPA: peptidoglycan-associated lipoprotein Pal [Steroidobacteraceae bacterium]|nr:peptidoglycan-associated lipoprotein Pal [Steroidobacteraceae bacterium]
MRLASLLMIVAATTLLAGCPKRPTTVPGDTGTGAAGQTTTGAGTTGYQGTEGTAGGTIMDAEQQARAELERLGMVIYFDFDRAEIKPEYVSVLAAHARYLNDDPGRRVRLEGHTDERGSREYNIGLGERRAQAVRRALLLQGVAEDQIVTVSYGEERPAVLGSDEEAYARNRRVEISYP